MRKKGRNYKRKVLINHALKLCRLRIRFKDIRRRKNKARLGRSKTQRESDKISERFRDYKKICAPSVFSIIENTEESLLFISKLEKCLENKQKVFVILTNVEQIADGAIVVLLSIMTKFKSQNIDFNGNFPTNQTVKKELIESGFFKELYRKNIQFDSKYEVCNNKVLTHANKIVDPELSDRIITEVSSIIWKSERRCPGLQRVFIELMQNTNNHASYINKGEHHWWITVQVDKDKSKAYFSFIDYGVGIINSLTNDEKGKFYRVIPLIKRLFLPENSSDILLLLLNGEIHKTSTIFQKTSTGKYYRGKGLPCLFNACRDNKIANAVVITNDAKVEYNKQLKSSLNTVFKGTFIYWELNKNNINIEK